MERSKFEELYAQVRSKAVEAAVRVCGNRDDAEDAVQETALYFLERLEANPRITPSLFVERACQRAKNRRDPRAGQNKFEVALGTALDLDRALYGPDGDED